MGKKHKFITGKPAPVTTEEQDLAKALGLAPNAEAPQAEVATPETKGGEIEAIAPQAEAPAEAKELDAGDALEALINKIQDEGDRELARKFLNKLQEDRKRTGQVKAWKAFDEELKTSLPNIFGALALKHGVELVNRRIVVTFPNGRFSHTNAVVGKGSNGKGSGTRQGFPEGWGKAGNGEQEHNSPSALANTLGLQITGHRDMVDVFESQGYTVTELPACGRADVVLANSDKDRAERLKGLVKEGGKFKVVKAKA